MRRIPALVIGLCALLAAAAPPARAEERIAVVDMVELILKHPNYKRLNDTLEKRKQDAKQYVDREQKALVDLRGQIELLNENDPKRARLEKELALSLSTLKFELEWRETEAMKEYMRGLESLHSAAHAAVSAYARENKISAVLQKISGPLDPKSTEDYGVKVRLRGVVYSEARLDITDAILRSPSWQSAEVRPAAPASTGARDARGASAPPANGAGGETRRP